MKMLIYAIMFLLWLGLGYVIVFITSNLPGMHGVIHVNRSSGNGTIYRLLDGIPHIHADSLEMGYYTLGFAMSTDRVFHMDKLRRIAQGRLSEIFGEAALNVDKAMRNLGFEYLAKMIYQNMDDESKQLLRDFSDGINDYPKYFSEGIDYWLLGTEFEKWKPEDSLSIYLFVTFSLSRSDEIYREYLYSQLENDEMVDEILPFHPSHESEFSTPVMSDEELKEFGFYKKDQLMPKKAQSKRKMYEFIEENIKEEIDMINDIKNLYSSGAGASNWWAVSGEYTKSGKPMLVNDPHLDPTIPSPFYLAELNIKDDYVVGALPPGVPFVVSGRTNSVAFGTTSLNADILDFFEEKINGTEYLTRGKWEELMTREEVINVKDGEPETIIIRSTHHGPVLDHVGAIMNAIDPTYPPIKMKVPIAMSWSGYQFKNNGFEIYLKQIYFKDVKEFMKESQKRHGFTYGVCWADIHGNIGYSATGSFPKRNDIFEAVKGIKEGWTGKHDWNGFIPAEEVPFMINPKKGYIFTANGRISSEHVEHGIGLTQSATARAARINYLLNDLLHVQKKKVDQSDMKRILNDTYDMYAAIKTPLMIQIIEQDNILQKYIKDENALKTIKGWIEHLKNWNYEFNIDMKEPTIFTLWEIYFYDSIFKNQITNDKLRNHASMLFGHDDFIVKMLQKMEKNPTHFSNYWYSDAENTAQNWRRALAKGLEFVYNYLAPTGTPPTEEDMKYGNWHKVQYRYVPFTRTPLKILFDRSDSDSGSKNTINVGSIYYSEFQEKGLESHHVPTLRLIVDFGNDKDNQFSIDTGCSENIVGKYFYYNLHDNHMSLEMQPMNFNSLNTTHTHRYSTMRLIYKNWFDEQEERLKIQEELANEKKKLKQDGKKEDL